LYHNYDTIIHFDKPNTRKSEVCEPSIPARMLPFGYIQGRWRVVEEGDRKIWQRRY